MLYLPWGLYCVENGTHSAASGIALGDGVMTVQDICDLSAVLDRIELGDRGIVRRDTGALVGTSSAWPVLALIGLGKLLLSHEQGAHT